jgi:hypothetical protein
MTDQPTPYVKPVLPETIYVEKWATFTLKDGIWDVQLWANAHRPLVGKVFKVKIPVPAELIDVEIVASLEPES